MTIGVVLLAAGRSLRFGGRNKLTVPLDGLPLGLHAARTLSGLPLGPRIIVTSSEDVAWPGYRTIFNDQSEAGMSRSIRLGIEEIRGECDAVLIALADMPFISSAHIDQLVARFDGPQSLLCSTDGKRRSPPALFGSAWFDALCELTGDAGAREWLANADPIAAPHQQLLDIDRPSDLAELRL